MEPTNTAFKIVKTNKAGLNGAEVTNGAVYFVQDTKELYFDFNNVRTSIQDIIILNNDADRTSILFAPLNKFYFALDTGKLYLYKDGVWHTITTDLSGYVTNEALQTILQNYLTEIPVASSTTLGGVKVGNNLSIDANGVLSADAQQMDVDNSTIVINAQDKLEVQGVKNANDGTLLKHWSGTLAQYNALETKQSNTVYYITDDSGSVTPAIEVDTEISSTSENPVQNKVIYTALQGKMPITTKYGYSIDLDVNTTTYVVTLALKDQDGTTLSTDTIDLPLESVVVSGSYNDTTKRVVLTLQNGSTIDFSIADLVSGLQTEINDLDTIRSGAALGATALQSVPVATSSTLGGIKVGNNLSITNDGTLSADAQQMGVDNSTIEIDSNDNLHVLGVANVNGGALLRHWTGTTAQYEALTTKSPDVVYYVTDGDSTEPVITVDDSLSSTSENPVQNKVIYNALQGKVSTETGKGLSTNDYTTAEKTKLAGLQNYTLPTASDTTLGGVKVDGTTISIDANGVISGSSSITVDSTLSTTSTNPVQNNVITNNKTQVLLKTWTNSSTSTDTIKSNFIINKMTKAIYNAITPSEDQLYIITDDDASGGIDFSTIVDGTSITYTNDILSCQGVKTQQGSVMTVWIGTQAEYDTAWSGGQIPATMLCIVTDA